MIVKINSILTLAAISMVAGACEPTTNPEVAPTTITSKAKLAADNIALTVPFWGNYASSIDNVKWYNYGGSTEHKPFKNFNDANAYDINLNSNREKGLSLMAPLSGTVISLATAVGDSKEKMFPGTLDGGTYGAVLIDHGNDLFTGYMHLATINVKAKDVVRAGQEIGTIGDKGVAGVVHLHFAAYKKESKVLVSKPITFTNRPFSLPLIWEVIRFER